MKKVALSGAGGIVGGILRKALQQRGVNLRSAGWQPLEPLHAGEDLVHGDLRDPAVVDRLLAGVDVLIHLAGTSVERPLPEIIDNNLRALVEVYEGARRHGVRRIVFASSNHAFGMYRTTDRLPLDAPVRPDGFYGLSKVWGEALARMYWDKHGIEGISLRIGTCMGKPPENERQLSTWLGTEDLLQLVTRCIEAQDVGYTAVWAISNNTRAWYELAEGNAIGYAPVQDAERWADEVLAQPNTMDAVGRTFQGGTFASHDYTADAARRRQEILNPEPATMQTASPPLHILMHPQDNVAIVANDGGLPAGTELSNGLVLREKVPQGHKVALVDIPAGSPVRRYDVAIGTALKDIAAGTWVHERLLEMPGARSLEDLPMATRGNAQLQPLEGFTFEGYRNADGSVGTRNILAITQSVQCVAGVTRFAIDRIKSQLLPRYPNVDDVVALEHGYGCGVAIDAPDAVIPIRTLRNISLNPNFGGEVMVVSLGCEKLQPERLLPPGTIPIADARGEELDVVCLQDDEHVGFMSMVESIVRQAEVHLERLNRRRRVTVPASELVVGVQCGGSDAFSGVTANPAVGFCTDLLVRAGATVMFSETTEVRDGVAQLTARAASPEIAQAIVREMAWYDAYLQRGSVDRSANTSPGNKKGGLSNIVEKAMGSIVKSGSVPITGVLAPGEKAKHKGLYYAATPASDFICGTLQLAAGMNLHVFTTGRGTPYGLAEVPVIKVATRSDLARRWHDLMDVNAGTIAEGKASIEEVGWELFRLMLDVASGRKKTWAEQWKLHNQLVLFNPAPVT